MREALAFLLLVCACGAATWSGRASDARRPRGDSDLAATGNHAIDMAAGPAASVTAPGGVAGQSGVAGQNGAFAALEARSASLAPGMRLALEKENGGERVELVRATERDTCVRVAYESAGPVLARLLRGDGSVICETPVLATSGVLGERGPVCVRKSDSVSALAVGEGGPVRWVVWASP